MKNHILDNNGTGALNMALFARPSLGYFVIDPTELKDCFVIWRNKKTIHEMATNDENIPKHNQEEKIDKIKLVEKSVRKNEFTDTTLFGMRKDRNSPLVITDGIHRAIGIYKVLLKNPKLKEKMMIRLLLVEGDHIENIDDYRLSVVK